VSFLTAPGRDPADCAQGVEFLVLALGLQVIAGGFVAHSPALPGLQSWLRPGTVLSALVSRRHQLCGGSLFKRALSKLLWLEAVQYLELWEVPGFSVCLTS